MYKLEYQNKQLEKTEFLLHYSIMVDGCDLNVLYVCMTFEKNK